MDLHVTLVGRNDLSARIYRQIFDAVIDGRLRPGERLPPTRELARRLAVSRNTVSLAYERLVSEGVLAGKVGSGTFVCTRPAASSTPARRVPPGGRIAPREVWTRVLTPSPSLRSSYAFDFRVGSPDASLFPFTAWRRLVAREWRPSRLEWSRYGEPAGHAGLRAAVARHCGLSRSVHADADDVIVTQGAQQALDVLARVVMEPGDVVAVEEPGYPPARLLFQSHGARVVGVPVDAEGLVVSALPRAARVVYVTPSHQFPLGTPMSLARRLALLAWAERRNGLIIEDDYDSEFRFEGRPLEPIQSLDLTGRVVYVGSFSKAMLPALRLGFMVVPPTLREACLAARQLSDWHGALPLQAALARFIDEGLFARHVRKASREYAARHARLTDGLQRHLGRWLSLVPSAAGLHVAARADAGCHVPWTDVVQRAADRGTFARTLSFFSTTVPERDGLVLGYGAIAADRVDEGLRRIAVCITGRRHT